MCIFLSKQKIAITEYQNNRHFLKVNNMVIIFFILTKQHESDICKGLQENIVYL